MRSAPTAFRLRGLRVDYRAHRGAKRSTDPPALEIDDLRVAAGETVAIVGPSGAGKTTLLRTMGAALRPSSGSVAVAGRPLSELAPSELRRVRADIGFVHQDFGLVPNLRVLHNVLFGKLGRLSFGSSLWATLFPRRTDVLRAYELLDSVGIADKLYERTDRLSGGQRQRVAVARALFQSPRALLADEPVASVDPARAHATLDLLIGICREHGLTLCASLHNLELARDLFPRLIGLRGGRILFDRPTAEVGAEELASLYDLTPDAAGDAHD